MPFEVCSTTYNNISYIDLLCNRAERIQYVIEIDEAKQLAEDILKTIEEINNQRGKNMTHSHHKDMIERNEHKHYSNMYYVFDRLSAIEFLWATGFKDGRESIYGGEDRTLYTKEDGWLE